MVKLPKSIANGRLSGDNKDHKLLFREGFLWIPLRFKKRSENGSTPGCQRSETENTCAAFVAAGNRSYFGVETDVHVTADGQFIIIHESNTGRVATEAVVTVFIPFDFQNLLYVRKYAPDVAAQYLMSKTVTAEHIDAMVDNKLDLDIYDKLMTKELLDTLHAKGIKANCWTVDDPERAEKLVSWVWSSLPRIFWNKRIPRA